MSRKRRALASAAAAVAVALAAGLALLAQDALGWRDSLRDEDVRFQAAPGRADWESRERAPFSLAKRAMALGDDVQLRRALRLFQLARTPAATFEGREARVAMRVQAIIALAQLERDETDPLRRATAANLLGLLSFDEAVEDQRNAGALLRRSLSEFRRAIAYNPASEEAKVNLELVLRLLEPEAQESRERVGIYGSGEGIGAGASRAGRGY